MNKIKMLNRISLDGYFASSNETTFGMDWFIHDPEVDRAAHEIGGPMKILILGGTTFRLFERYWPPLLSNPDTPSPLKETAQELTDMTKIVFTKTIRETEWANTRIYEDDLAGVARQLKRDAGCDILVLGSGSIVRQLAEEGLIDEYIFIVSPIVSGTGKPLFDHVKQFALTPLESRVFESGNVLLHYVRPSY